MFWLRRFVPGDVLGPDALADKAVGRPTLCMMTSNVFGNIAADNLGYAKGRGYFKG